MKQLNHFSKQLDKHIYILMESDSQKLSIIFVTDFHMQNEYLKSLQKWYIQYSNLHDPFNYIFVGGDSMNIDNTSSTPQQQEKGEKQLYTYFDKLKEIFNCELIHIPGNHDPQILLTPQKTSRSKQVNVHNKIFKLASGLEVIGFGGSVPAYVGDNKEWEGYPFIEDQDLEKSFTKAAQFLAQKQNSQKQFILLTHVGPQQSSTTHDRRKLDKHISGGSKYLNKLLQRKDILLWVHGHIHNGGSIDYMNGLPIVNPGPLVYGRFCTLQLEKPKIQDKWVLKTINIQHLHL